MEGVTFRELDGDGNPIEPQQVEEIFQLWVSF